MVFVPWKGCSTTSKGLIVNFCRAMAQSPDQPDRRRAHVERMLFRAERRSRQAAKLVEKWKARLADLDREGIAAKQAKLWTDAVVSRGG